ncbi:hypothetical protein CEQ90_14885 [Lewinellaceae bacterium SD302]|nr:hypothetical protein CEQ90_14885 [Lewinellaceae bacterium SD302]
MSGRITAIDVNPKNKDIMFAGAASGGVWRSKNGGIDWHPVFDEQKTAAIGSISISDSNPNVIWVGTGEGNPRNSANYGGGIYRSLDGGDSWKFMGLKNTRAIHRVIVHPENPDVVWAGAFGSMWGPNKERGVYKTTDGGKNWKKVLYVDEETGVADLIIDPTNPNKLLAAMWTNDRDPWFFNSGGKGSGIWVTYDGGNNWKRRTAKDGLPKGDLGRIGLAIAASKPDIVYALVEAKENGLYKSTDGGKTFSLVSKKNIGNRPFYYAELYVDPQNENRIFNIYTYVSRSEDGGKSFKVIADYGNNVHPDHHAFWIDPDNPEFIIDGNDGGLNISRDGGDTWRFAENLPVGQFYHVNYDMDIPYHVGGGMQDNGSWVGPAYVWKSGGITAADWQEVRFGDGFDIMFKPDNNRYVYAASQGGSVGLVDRETGASQFIKPVHPDGEFLRFNWNAAMSQSPHDVCTIFYGSQYVHKSTDCGQHWEIISPDLTTNDSTKQKQDISGGLTIDATQAENHTTILSITQDPFDKNTIWATTDDGQLQVTRDGGENWENQSARLGGIAPNSWLGYFEVSKINPGEAFLAANDYRRNDFAPYLYHTKNYGQSWQRIENDIKGHTMCIVQDPLQENHLWAGTDQGLFYSHNYGKNWHKYDQGFPTVPVRDLKIHPREHDLIVGTFGRAIWILDDLRPFREMARTEGKVLQDSFALFSAPDAYQAEYRSYQGIRFVAQGNYAGENRDNGARLTYWVKPPAEEKDREKKPKDKVKIQIVNSTGDTIRTFTRKPQQWGMNRSSWNMRRDGIEFPSRRERKADADRNSGSSVLPGTYRVVMTYGNHVNQTTVTVHPDPRLKYTAGMYDVQQQMQARMDSAIVRTTRSWNLLRDARKGIKLTQSMLVHADKDLKDTLNKQAKELIGTIDSLEAIVMDPPDQKGIQRNPVNLQAKMWQARGYVRQIEGSSSQMADVSLRIFEEESLDFIEAVRMFVNEDLQSFREQLDGVEMPLFGSDLDD